MALSRKTRPLKAIGGQHSRCLNEERLKVTGKWVTLSESKVKLPLYHGDQITDSEGHDWPPAQGGQDVGGAFFTQKRYGSKHGRPFQLKKEIVINRINSDRERVTANASPSCPIETTGSVSNVKPSWPAPLASANADLQAAGATAVSRCKPTSGESELSTALGELFREGLPNAIGARTWSKRTRRAQEAAGEYLNVEFGWLPLVDEVQKLARSLADSDRIVQQYERDRGRLVRRSYSFPVEKTTNTTILSTTKSPDGLPQGIRGDFGPSTLGTWSRTTTTYKRRWFSGAFIYGTPTPGTQVEASATLAQKADQVFGLSLTPDVLWNLTPWSWAIDWVTNTGDVLSNISDRMTHGLVMQYGYLMEHTIHKKTYSLTDVMFHGNPVRVPDATLVTETKSRTKAHPFGFGVTWDGLSAAQGAILAALGISRA